ncbi:hypothetical protein BBJ28_00005206, partial [Nothophytophthora sp. Chile5]
TMASLLLEHLTTKAAVDDAIRNTKDRVLVLRFGHAADSSCLQQDDIVRVFVGAWAIVRNMLCCAFEQVIYRGAKHGKSIVTCPIEKSHIPQYELIYKDI